MAKVKYDPKLGDRVRLWLEEKGIETPMHEKSASRSIQDELKIADACNKLVEGLGLKMDDDSIQGTPGRLKKMYMEELFYGMDYAKFPECTSHENKMNMDEMVAEKSTVKSMCEHHFVPFVGHAWIGYIPAKKQIGLSKLNRIVDFFSRRPQVQERLTLQISETLKLVLETDDVAVVIRAKHMCVLLRGVQDDISETITSKLSGRFMTKPELRSEFIALTR